MIQYT